MHSMVYKIIGTAWIRTRAEYSSFPRVFLALEKIFWALVRRRAGALVPKYFFSCKKYTRKTRVFCTSANPPVQIITVSITTSYVKVLFAETGKFSTWTVGIILVT